MDEQILCVVDDQRIEGRFLGEVSLDLYDWLSLRDPSEESGQERPSVAGRRRAWAHNVVVQRESADGENSRAVDLVDQLHAVMTRSVTMAQGHHRQSLESSLVEQMQRGAELSAELSMERTPLFRPS
ncbi:hypothetical protein [Microbacterium sp. KNMS]